MDQKRIEEQARARLGFVAFIAAYILVLDAMDGPVVMFVKSIYYLLALPA